MSEPDWKTELRSELEEAASDIERGNRIQGGVDYARQSLVATVFEAVEDAYQRGLQAGRSQGRYTTGRKKWRKEDDPCTADAEGHTPASTAADEPPQGSAP